MSDTENNSKPEWAKTKSELRRERGEKPSRRGWIIFAIIVVGIIGIAVVGKSMQPADDMVAAEPDIVVDVKYLAQEETATVLAVTLQRQIKVTGTVQPLNVAQLPALISAQVERVRFRVGDPVKKGNLLLLMDTESLEIQKEQQVSGTAATEAQLALAESQLKRTQDLSKQGIAPSSQLEQALSTVDAQKANLQAQKSQIKATDYQLRNAKVYAPISGVVSQRQAEPGQFVGAGSPLMEVVDLSVMELAVNVSTTDSAKIVKGMAVELVVEGLPGTSYTGKVSRLSPVAARGTRTIPVYIEIENKQFALRGGMFAIGRITLEEQAESIAITSSAIRVDENNESYVLKISDGIAVKQLIGVAGVWGEQELVEITSGLIAGDQIIVLPLQGLNAGDSVALIEG